MSVSDFVHLHNHTQYSKFDGFSSVEDIVKRAKELNMSAVGLTDHGTVAGAISFLTECRKASISPIIGSEMYLCRDYKCHNSTGQKDARKGNRHINIIAKNYKGFQNLCALSHISSLEGYYYDPRIDFELLSQYKEGLIVTSACLSNIINWHLSKDRYEHAKSAVSLFKDVFEEDFYLEIMYHGIDLEGKILPDIIKLGHEMGVKVCATNDTHYPKREDAEFHEYIMCISSGRTIRDPKRIKFPYQEFYFKSQNEMSKLFGHIPSVLRNTKEVAEKCDYSDIILGGQMLLPKFELPAGFSSPHDYLEKLAYDGLKKVGLDKSDKHIARLKQELDDIRLTWKTKRYDFATYFLIVYDIMRFARENNIDAGIRGSGYGSMLIKSLGISEGLDPIEQKLFWERFLGFSDKYFICEDDFGINGEPVSLNKNTQNHSQTKDAAEIMFERYH